MLLTGDIENKGEQGMLNAGAELRADVIKIAHHGSKTSSSQLLVEAVRARYAIISVGQTSIFGHPNPEVVERWRTSGAQVLTTGNCGTITVVTDGHQLSVKTFVQPH
jgi:competence protein ComEC